jgi:nucleotide-binding universal stress UspA family protein
MSTQRILVPFDGSSHSEAATRYAFEIAKAVNAEIEGLGMVDVGPIERVQRGANVGGFAFAEGARKSMLARAQGHAAEFQHEFLEQCRQFSVAYDYRFEVADPIERIAARSFFADLVVMGMRTDFDPESESDSCDKLRKAMNATPRPFLAVPIHHREIKRALVALDFDDTCSRLLFGLAQANPFPEAEYTLLHVGDDEAAVRPRLTEAAEYLAAHRLRTVVRLEKGEPKEAVPRFVEQEDFDLAVVGGASGSRLAEFLFGGVTRRLLEKATCPILTIH